MQQFASLSDAGGLTHTIEQAAPIDTVANIKVEAKDLADFPAFTALRWSHCLQYYLLADAVLDGGFDGLRTSDNPIEDFCLGGRVGFDKIDLSRLHRDDSSLISVIGFNWACTNYYHWLVQALPSIYVLSRIFGLSQIQLVVPALSHIQEQTLEALGLHLIPRIIVQHDQQYFFKRASFTNVLTARCTTYDGFAAYAHRLKRSVSATARRNGRRLYISRADTLIRRLTNEAEVIRIAIRHGFEIVEAAHLSFDEQMRLFAEADIVIGPHGAGMANTIFCRPGTIVYEFMTKQYYSACMCVIAQNMSLRYYADFFDVPGGTQLVDWVVDTRRVDERLRQLVRQLGAPERPSPIWLRCLRREQQNRPF